MMKVRFLFLRIGFRFPVRAGSEDRGFCRLRQVHRPNDPAGEVWRSPPHFRIFFISVCAASRFGCPSYIHICLYICGYNLLRPFIFGALRASLEVVFFRFSVFRGVFRHDLDPVRPDLAA